MRVSVEHRARLILAAEETLAQDLARGVLPRPKPSVWMILLPPLFVFFALAMDRHKKASRMFKEGFLFTKRLALERVVRELGGEAVGPLAFPDPPAGVGTPEAWARIRAAQAEEVTLLQGHYRRLLLASASTFAGLVQGAYATPGEYLAFCNALRRAEMAVNAAIVAEVHSSAEAREAARAMETRLEHLRLEQVQRIFSGR